MARAARLRITVTDLKDGSVVARFANPDDAFIFARESTDNHEDDRVLVVNDRLGYINTQFKDGFSNDPNLRF